VKLVQSIATVELIVEEDWVEPADLAPLGLSTLVHQTLAMLAEPAGISAARAWNLLCVSGPWRRVTATDYAALLGGLAGHGLVRQDARGLLFLDEAGLESTSTGCWPTRSRHTPANAPSPFSSRPTSPSLTTTPSPTAGHVRK
jgi:hypothetical protein